MVRLLALLAAAALIASAETHLTAEWMVDIARPDRSVNYQAAVCPDGWLYLTNGEGQVVALSPGGELSAPQSGLAGFLRASTVACGPNGLMAVAGGGGFDTYRRDWMQGLTRILRGPPVLRISRMAIASDGRVFATGFNGPNSTPLHLLSSQGMLLHSFGEAPSIFIFPPPVDAGFPLWAGSEDQLIFVSRNPYEVRLYDLEGTLIRSIAPDGIPAVPIWPVAAGERRVDQVVGVAQLGEGRMAVQLRVPRAGWVIPSRFWTCLTARSTLWSGPFPRASAT